MKDAMELMNSQFEALSKENSQSKQLIKDLQAQNINLKSTVDDLKQRVNTLEQNARSNNIEIQCVPERKSENVLEVVQQLGSVINYKVNPENILHCSRVAKLNRNNDRPRSIVAQFSNTKIRDEFLAAAINFNKKKPIEDKLNSTHLGLQGTESPIFIVDHLSPSNKALHAAARAAAKEKGFKYVWVRSSRIYMRKSDASDYILIKDFESLNKLQ